jgi:hypothetical protein
VTIPLPVIPLTFRCTLRWDGGAVSPIPVNVIHIAAGTGPVLPSDIFTALNATVTQMMWAPLPGFMIVGHVDIIPLDGITPTQTFATGGGTKWQGATTGSGVPQTAALVKLTTAARGRKHRGRIYLPWAGENAITAGTVDSTTLGPWQAAWSAFLAALPSSGSHSPQLVVASYDRAHGGAGSGIAPVTSVTCETLTATQRRRQPGR